MELRMTIPDPLLVEVKQQARVCGLTPQEFAKEVILCFAATRRFWRMDDPVSGAVGTTRETQPPSIPVLDGCVDSSTDFPAVEGAGEREAQPVVVKPSGLTGCVDRMEDHQTEGETRA